MRRRRREPTRISYETFWRTVTKDGRCVCALWDVDCDGPLDAHHFFPKRRIDLQLGGKFKPASIRAKQDVRNGVPLCRFHHEQVEFGRPCPRPELYGFFLADHGLVEPIKFSRTRARASSLG